MASYANDDAEKNKLNNHFEHWTWTSDLENDKPKIFQRSFFRNYRMTWIVFAVKIPSEWKSFDKASQNLNESTEV